MAFFFGLQSFLHLFVKRELHLLEVVTKIVVLVWIIIIVIYRLNRLMFPSLPIMHHIRSLY